MYLHVIWLQVVCLTIRLGRQVVAKVDSLFAKLVSLISVAACIKRYMNSGVTHMNEPNVRNFEQR